MDIDFGYNNMDLEKAKQCFNGKDYPKAIQIVKKCKQSIPVEKKALALDIQACSLFMIKDYKSALNIYDQAIEINPYLIDLQISKGATLRCLEKETEAIEILKNAQCRTKDPAINFNLRILSRVNQEITAQTQLISKKQKFNPDYDKFGGIVPSFMKRDEERSDFVLSKEKQLISQICAPILNKNQWPQHFQKLDQLFEARENMRTNLGVEFSAQNCQLLDATKKILDALKNIQNNMEVQVQRQQIIEWVINLFSMMKAYPEEAKQIVESQINNINKSIILKSEKELHLYQNWQTFEEVIKQVESLHQNEYKIRDSIVPQIRLLITQKNCFVYIDIDFKRSLTPTRSLKLLQELPLQKAKVIFNLYWFICLRIIFNSQQGINLQQFLQFRKAFEFIYEEIDGALPYKFPEEEFVSKSIHIFEKYNEIFSTHFLNKNNKKMVYQNCEEFKNFLSQIDENFESILKKQLYIEVLTESVQQDDQNYFRSSFNLTNCLQDKIAEDLTLVFYEFRTQCQLPHHILLKAFAQMANESKKTLSGKKSFFQNYLSWINPPSFVQKLLEKLTA